MLISTSSAHSATSRLFLRYLHCNLNYSIPFQLKILLCIHQLPQAARLPTGTSAFSCQELWVLETLMAAGSTSALANTRAVVETGKIIQPSEYIDSLTVKTPALQCLNTPEPLKQCLQGFTVARIMTRPRCDMGVHSPPHAPGITTGLLINQDTLSSSQSPVHLTFSGASAFTIHPSKNQKDSYTIPSFPAVESKSYFLICIYTQADKKLNPALTQTTEIRSSCRGICKNKTLEYQTISETRVEALWFPYTLWPGFSAGTEQHNSHCLQLNCFALTKNPAMCDSFGQREIRHLIAVT